MSFRCITHFIYLSCALVLSASAYAEEINPLLPKECKFPKTYSHRQLDNGLRVLTISDPSLNKARFSLEVGVGTQQDPEDILGMAHFLEHMLFLGSKNYPAVDSLQSFLAQHGGSINATTDYEATNYHFDVDPEHLEKALDLFSDAMAAPTLDTKYVGRERKAIQAEYRYRKDMYYWRLSEVAAESFADRHPITRFGMGNRKSFAAFSDAELAQRVRAWWEAHYSADKMVLVVSAPQSNELLETLLKDRFSHLPIRPSATPPSPPKALSLEKVPSIVKAKLNDDERYMILYFPIENIRSEFKSAPEEFISYLLEQQVPNTLSSSLRDNDYASGLSVQFNTSDPDASRIEIYIDLYYQGGEQYWDVIRRLMAYADLLKKEPLDEWRYKEFLKHKGLQKCFFESLNITETTSNLRRYGPNYALAKGYVSEEFKPQLYQKLLDAIRPDNMIAVIAHPNFIVSGETKWFHTAYSANKLSVSDQKHYKPKGDYGFLLPSANQFLPKGEIEVISGSDDEPHRLSSHPNINAWHGKNTEVGSPLAYYYVLLRSPEMDQDRRSSALSQLFWSLLQDKLKEQLSIAEEINTSLNISRVKNGFELQFQGYPESIELLLTNVLNEIKDFREKERHYEEYRYGWMYHLKKYKERTHPLVMANFFTDEIIHLPSYGLAELASGMREASYPRMINLLGDFRDNLHVTTFSYGNIEKPQAEKWSKMISDTIISETNSAKVREYITRLPLGITHVIEESEFTDSVSMIYVQGNSASYSEQANFGLLEKMLSDSFFKELRTEKQLGYVVHATISNYLNIPGMNFIMQSPVSAPDRLEQETLSFLEYFQGRLTSMQDNDFDVFKNSLTAELNAPKKTQEKSSLYWREIANGSLHFDSEARMADAIKSISKDSFIEWYRNSFVSKNKRVLSVLIEGKSHAIGSKWKSKISDTLLGSLEKFHDKNPKWVLESPQLESAEIMLSRQ
ncbi:insulinase family protein [Hahella sp. HN01]|uniref:insulinase family protein n=1 Tax=Hahella sp. HN01 TaxID=2847262 RepID=UPI001C1EB2C3|nr:insulinase family protein [Hahella sp. HN01]